MSFKFSLLTGLISTLSIFSLTQPTIAKTSVMTTENIAFDFSKIASLVSVVTNKFENYSQQFTPIAQNPLPKVRQYLESAAKKSNQKDYQGALADLNSAIQLDPKSIGAYNNRALIKYRILNDQPGGIYDLQQVVKLLEEQGKQKDAQRVNKLVRQWQVTSQKSSIP